MDAFRALEEALNRRDWDDVEEQLNSSFFRYLADAPDLLERVFSSVPHEWYAHPRYAMARAIATAARHPGMVIDPEEQERFRAWVDEQPDPAARDLLGVAQATLRDMLAHGWHDDASALVDDVLVQIRSSSTRSEGFRDILPSVLLRCGAAKLLAGDTDAAASCFADALHWATLRDEHPYARYAREHLALVHALNDRYVQAATLLDGPIVRSAPGTLRHHLEAAGILARALVATASLDCGEVERAFSSIDDDVIAGPFGWIAVHAQTQVALAEGTTWQMIHAINTSLVADSRRTPPQTIAGSMIRGDLVALYQSVDDLRAAERVITTPGILRRQDSVITPLARQALLRGRPEHALHILRQNELARAESIPARHTPAGAVVYAAAELAASQHVSPATLNLAATTINHHGAFNALAQAPAELRPHLFPLIQYDTSRVPAPWAYRERIRLTRREREVLNALAAHTTVNEAAAALHVSTNTAKTHVRALYRKLGAHSRDEALWLGRD